MALVSNAFKTTTAQPSYQWQDDTQNIVDTMPTYTAPDLAPVSTDFSVTTPSTTSLPDLSSLSQALIENRRQQNAQADYTNAFNKAYGTALSKVTTTSGGGSYSGKRSGSFGPEAYGFHGTTGQASQRGSSPFGFQPKMWAALSRANAAMKAAGLGTFGVTDGFRSYSLQVSTKKRKGSLAATPGRSVHGLGLAADLKLSHAQLAWLKKNGGKYGLVNLPSESWHWQLDPRLA